MATLDKCTGCNKLSMGRCTVVKQPVALLNDCPEKRWDQSPEPIKLLWISGDMSKGGCTRYSRDIIKILRQLPLQIEVVWFQDHFYDKFVHDEIAALVPVSRYNPATFKDKVMAADVVSSMNLNQWAQDHSKVLDLITGRSFMQVHGTCPYTQDMVNQHKRTTKYFLACSHRAAKLCDSDAVIIAPPSPIDWNRVTRQKSKTQAKKDFCGVSADTTVITYAGRLAEDKGIIKSAHLVKELSPEAKFLVVGNGHHQDLIIPELKSILGDQLILKSWASYPTDYLDASDVFMCMGREEGLPLTLIEALCHGTPVVSTDVGVAYDYVIHVKGSLPTRVVFPFESVETIKEALAFNNVEQRLATLELLQTCHSEAVIREEWWKWLSYLNKVLNHAGKP